MLGRSSNTLSEEDYYAKYIKKKNAILKIVLIGDSAVGKTSLRKRYLGEGFKDSSSSTTGMDTAIKRMTVENYRITFQIWDIAGQKRFDNVRELYYSGARGAVLVFDISNPSSFNNLPNWLEGLWKKTGPIPMILCGNKIDLRDKIPKDIPFELGQEYTRRLSEAIGYEIPYLETSAKTGEKVDEAFFQLGLSIIRDAKTRESIVED